MTDDYVSPGPLKRKAQRGAVAVALQRNASEGIAFVISIVLARLLPPSDFGLIGMMAIFLSTTQQVTTGLFSPALTQRETITDEGCSTVFFANLALSLTAFAALFVAAPAIGRFYGYPSLAPLLRVAAFQIVVTSLAAVPAARFVRDLNFRPEFIANVTSTAVSGVVAIALALAGMRVWSLIALTLTARLVMTFALWAQCSWRPRIQFSLATVRDYGRYGLKLVTHNFMESVFFNLHGLIFGKMYTSSLLGFYNRGRTFPLMITGNFIVPLNRVMFPSFARMQREHGRLAAAFGRSVNMLLFILVPSMVGLAVVAEPLVSTLLTDAWLPSVPYLRVFCVLAALTPLRRLSFDIFKSQDRPGVGIRLQIGMRIASVIALIVSLRYGPLTILLAECAVASVATAVYLFTAAAMVGMRATGVAPTLAYLTLNGMGTAAAAALSMRLFETPALQLLAAVLSGTTIYLAMSLLQRLAPCLEWIEFSSHLLPRSTWLKKCADWAESAQKRQGQ